MKADGTHDMLDFLGLMNRICLDLSQMNFVWSNLTDGERETLADDYEIRHKIEGMKTSSENMQDFFHKIWEREK